MRRWRLLPLLLLCAAAAASTGAAERHFLKPETLPHVRDVFFTHVADFTGDGQNDLLYAGSDVTVFPGDHGRWSAPLASWVESSYARITGVADFNGDGALDLYGVSRRPPYYNSYGYDELIVALGDGQGRFGEARVTEVESDQLLVADFDRDGKPDAVTLDSYGSRLRFLRGNGDGTFASPVRKETPFRSVTDAAAGDFDGDGWIDVAAAGDGELAIFWNERGGPFRFQRYDIPAVNLVAGRMNGDRAADLLITSRLWWTRRRVTNVFFGTSGARVLTPAAHAFSSNDVEHRLRDLDGNGTEDIIARRDGAISIVLSARDGTFNAPLLYFVRAESFITLAGDFDSNGIVDVGWLDGDLFPDVPGGWLPGNGDGTLQGNRAVDLCDFAPCPDPGEQQQLRQEEVLDVTGDGAFDLVVYTQNVLTVVPAGPRGDYRRGVTTSVRDRWPFAFRNLVDAGDTNGDGHDDLLLVREERTRNPVEWRERAAYTVLLGQRDGTFEEGQVLNGMALWGNDSVSVRDVTGDGIADLVEIDGDVHPGDGRGHFGPALPDVFVPDDVDLDGPGWNSGDYLRNVVIADFTGDGLADRVELYEIVEDGYPQCCYVYTAGYEARVRRGTDYGTFEAIRSSIWIDADLDEGLLALDFDHDSDLDLLIGTNVYLGNGDGTFHSGSAYRADLADVVNGRIVARNAHTYAGLTVMEGPETGTIPVTLEVVPSWHWNRDEVLGAIVKADGPLRPGGTVRFELEGGTKVVQLEYGTALLDWEWAEGVTEVVATYSGDENFAPATVTIQRTGPVEPFNGR